MTPELQTNVLYDGDNLDILRRYVPDASVDVVYLARPELTEVNFWQPSAVGADQGSRVGTP